jgi:hypothetical protein
MDQNDDLQVSSNLANSSKTILTLSRTWSSASRTPGTQSSSSSLNPPSKRKLGCFIWIQDFLCRRSGVRSPYASRKFSMMIGGRWSTSPSKVVWSVSRARLKGLTKRRVGRGIPPPWFISCRHNECTSSAWLIPFGVSWASGPQMIVPLPFIRPHFLGPTLLTTIMSNDIGIYTPVPFIFPIISHTNVI